MWFKKCFKNGKKNRSITKNNLNINKNLCIHIRFWISSYYTRAPETDIFVLFKIFSTWRSFLGVNLIKESSEKYFLFNQFLQKQSRICSTNGYSFFQCVSRCKKTVMPDLSSSYSDRKWARFYSIKQKSNKFGLQWL